MSQKKYLITLTAALWLYLCASVVFFYPYDIIDAYTIVFGILGGVLGAALLVVALLFCNRQSFIPLHITFGVTAATAFVFWFIQYILRQGRGMHIFGALVALAFVAAYVLGIFVRRKNNQSPSFYRYACMFFAVLSLVCAFIPAVRYGTYYDDGSNRYYAVSIMEYSVDYLTLASAVLALLSYWLDYCGRLTPLAAHIIVGVGAALSVLLAWYGYLNIAIGLAIGSAAVVIICAAAYYLFAFTRRGRALVGLDAASEEAGTQSAAQTEDWMAELEKLNELRAAGVLTEEEYAAQKQKIIGGTKNV